MGNGQIQLTAGCRIHSYFLVEYKGGFHQKLHQMRGMGMSSNSDTLSQIWNAFSIAICQSVYTYAKTLDKLKVYVGKIW